MTRSGYLFLGLTAIVGMLAAVLAFAILRLFAAARAAAKAQHAEGAETAFMAAAMEDAVQRLRQQEQEMKARAEASERLSGQIIESMASGLLVVDDRRAVQTLNPAGRKLLGLPEADWSGDVRDVLGAESPLTTVIEECLSTGRPIVRRTITLKHGTTVSHLGTTVSPIRHDGGAVQGTICLFSDLSEIVELEDQLRLKDSLARLGEMTAGIAHEFRNGLATIHGYGRLLDLEQLPEEFRPYVQGIRDETEALGQVVTNFLNFARPTELVLAPVDMSALADRAAEEIRKDVQARGGHVRVHGSFAQVDGDEVLLRQALSNLCRNALEACADGHIAPEISIEGTCDVAQGVLRITVTDNGPGIDAAVAPRMFRPFVTTKARGTGLGLALVQKIVVTHNGKVAAQTDPGGGTRVTMTLPVGSAALP